MLCIRPSSHVGWCKNGRGMWEGQDRARTSLGSWEQVDRCKVKARRVAFFGALISLLGSWIVQRLLVLSIVSMSFGWSSLPKSLSSICVWLRLSWRLVGTTPDTQIYYYTYPLHTRRTKISSAPFSTSLSLWTSTTFRIDMAPKNVGIKAIEIYIPNTVCTITNTRVFPRLTYLQVRRTIPIGKVRWCEWGQIRNWSWSDSHELLQWPWR